MARISKWGEVMKARDITNQRFGRLIAIKRSSNKSGKTRWVCSCDCGNKTIAYTYHLTIGHTKSCGCLSREGTNFSQNGLSSSRLYRIWQKMKERCYYKDDISYKNYGGRGIRISAEWNNDFQKFYKWSKENGYNDKLMIDRIDNNQDYSPKNCRWVTRKEQNNNKRNNVRIEINGEVKNLTQWMKHFNLSRSTYYNRIARGWQVHEALTTPVDTSKSSNGKKSYKGD